MSRFQVYVGVDWGSRTSHAFATGCAGEKLSEGAFESHSELLAFLSKLSTVPGEVAVAFERRDLALVDAVLDAGYAAFSINPKRVDRFRDRFSCAGAKDDRRDAMVLSSSLRTDSHAFEQVAALEENQSRLRSLHRLRGRITKDARAAANQLLYELYRVFPTVVGLCPGADAVWFLDLVEAIFDAQSPADVPRSSIEDIIKKRRLRKLSVDDVAAVLQQPRPNVPRHLVADAGFAARVHLKQLRLLVEQQQLIEREIDMQLKAMRAPEGHDPTDVDLLFSMPGFGPIVVATLVAELGRQLSERDRQRLRILTGVAPVTKRSGKSHVVQRRLACNERARQAMFYAARVAIRDPRFREVYNAMRARGLNHARALRGVGDCMLRVLVGVLRTGKPYEQNHSESASKALADDPRAETRSNDRLAP